MTRVPLGNTLWGMLDMRLGTCPICSHNEIVRAVPKGFPESDGPLSTARLQNQAFGMAFGPTPTKIFGILNVYLCRSCGFVQWFAIEPDKVPIGEKYDTSLVHGPEPREPYR